MHGAREARKDRLGRRFAHGHGRFPFRAGLGLSKRPRSSASARWRPTRQNDSAHRREWLAMDAEGLDRFSALRDRQSRYGEFSGDPPGAFFPSASRRTLACAMPRAMSSPRVATNLRKLKYVSGGMRALLIRRSASSA